MAPSHTVPAPLRIRVCSSVLGACTCRFELLGSIWVMEHLHQISPAQVPLETSPTSFWVVDIVDIQNIPIHHNSPRDSLNQSLSTNSHSAQFDQDPAPDFGQPQPPQAVSLCRRWVLRATSTSDPSDRLVDGGWSIGCCYYCNLLLMLHDVTI